jgi:hypothetical protein
MHLNENLAGFENNPIADRRPFASFTVDLEQVDGATLVAEEL